MIRKDRPGAPRQSAAVSRAAVLAGKRVFLSPSSGPVLGALFQALLRALFRGHLFAAGTRPADFGLLLLGFGDPGIIAPVEIISGGMAINWH